MLDFFAQQDRARRVSKYLVIGFVLAVVVMLASVNLLAWAVFHALDDPSLQTRDHHPVAVAPQAQWQIYALINLFSLATIALGSLYKTIQLRGGGATVAAMMGGQLVTGAPATARERTLLNVVEEMAIASGVAVPPVYVMREESAINAFAAGHAPGDATITVSQGCLERLDRNELQGVIGHEFSHILNGDMRTNLRLIGVLHGILLIGLAGRLLLRIVGNSRSSSDDKGSAGIIIAVLALAITLSTVGYLGFFLGGLIKAALSRQREYLADASSVQFTRNPQGIAGALKKIGGGYTGARIRHAGTEQISHLFLGDALGKWTPWMATHPPIERRIRAVDPDWDGKFIDDEAPEEQDEDDSHPQKPALASAFAGMAPTRVAAPAAAAGTRSIRTNDIHNNERLRIDAAAVAGQVASVSPDHVAYGAAVLQQLPPALAAAAREPFTAQAIVYAILLDREPAKADAQLTILARAGEQALLRELAKLREPMLALDQRGILPLLDLCSPSLRQLSPAQKTAFATNLRALIAADNVVTVGEYCVYQLLSQQLAPPAPPPMARYHALPPVQDDLTVLLSALAYADGKSPAEAAIAFAAAASRLTDSSRPLALLLPERCDFTALDRALANLNLASPGLKRRIVTACAWCVAADGVVTVLEAELLRVASGALGCPLPPFMDAA